jgi:CheY-like chemotaxis protein
VAVRILRRNGYRVLDTANGDEAIAMLTLQPVDLLLTDVVMPQVSGREIAERARLHRPDLPVLFMSGYSQGVLGPRRGIEDDVPLIQKPFNEQALVNKVQALLSQHVAASRRGPGATS